MARRGAPGGTRPARRSRSPPPASQPAHPLRRAPRPLHSPGREPRRDRGQRAAGAAVVVQWLPRGAARPHRRRARARRARHHRGPRPPRPRVTAAPCVLRPAGPQRACAAPAPHARLWPRCAASQGRARRAQLEEEWGRGPCRSLQSADCTLRQRTAAPPRSPRARCPLFALVITVVTRTPRARVDCAVRFIPTARPCARGAAPRDARRLPHVYVHASVPPLALGHGLVPPRAPPQSQPPARPSRDRLPLPASVVWCRVRRVSVPPPAVCGGRVRVRVGLLQLQVGGAAGGEPPRSPRPK
jgi:hypothetical protein